MRKKGILIALLIMAIGFASITTTLYINGSANISSNNDFKVYYSDAFVNGNQDLSVVVDETHLSFSTTLDTLGQTYVLDYDVTNGSKNYDADLEMVCTGGNEWLTVTNEFDDENILEVLKTRRGKLTLTLSKSYAGDDLDVEIECTISANPSERVGLGEGTPADPVQAPKLEFNIGDELKFGEEAFNVIEVEEEYITLLSRYTVGPNNKQDFNNNLTSFSNVNGWDGGTTIDIQQYDGGAKNLVNNYVDYLKTIIGEDISGNIISIDQLNNLGCEIDEYGDGTCSESPYLDWLATGQASFTNFAGTFKGLNVLYMHEDASFGLTNYDAEEVAGIRPTIRIPRDLITRNNIGSPIEVYEPETFCRNKGYSYGTYYVRPYYIILTYYEDVAYYACSNDEEFLTGDYYSKYGVLVHSYDDSY